MILFNILMVKIMLKTSLLIVLSVFALYLLYGIIVYLILGLRAPRLYQNLKRVYFFGNFMIGIIYVIILFVDILLIILINLLL